ncbi:hypothetical protein [Streptomyces capitiformicae]|nr:hypothetical protein [Streptomyces capitiformicae]
MGTPDEKNSKVQEIPDEQLNEVAGGADYKALPHPLKPDHKYHIEPNPR